MINPHQHTRNTFQYGKKIVNYDLIRSKRRKTYEIIVDENEITIRAPYDKSLNDIEAILNEKIQWISQKQKEFRNTQAEIVKPIFQDHSTLPYVGKNYPLIVRQHTEQSFEFDNNTFIARLAGEKDNIETIKILYNEWLCSKAYTIFEEKVREYGRIIDVHPKRIVLKKLKKRWGSLSKDTTINLNVNLVKSPEDIVNYVIIHELCHIKIKGHSYRFWNYLKQFVPDYEQKIKWLERNTDSLL